MRKLVLILTLLLAFSGVLPAQNLGEIMPPIYPVFFNLNGVTPVANGFICTTVSGGTGNLFTYRTPALTAGTENQNPIRLNTAGRAVNGATLVPIYLQAASYRISVYAAGTGINCNGTQVGALLYQHDGVYNLAQLQTIEFATLMDDGVCHASQAPGANAGEKIDACIALLPTGGGTVDARGLEGSQFWTTDFLSTVTKPVTIDMGVGTTTLSVNMTVPRNVTLHFSNGSIISVNSALTLAINGPILAPLSQIFAGAGVVAFGNGSIDNDFPQWWGAKADGKMGLDCSMTSGSPALTISNAVLATADAGKAIIVYGAGAASQNLVTTITAVGGTGAATLAATAGTTTVANANCAWATDDTAALQSAINAYISVNIPPGKYGFTELLFRQGQRFIGAGKTDTEFYRLGLGVNGPGCASTCSAFRMQAGQTAEHLWMAGFGVLANLLGTNVHGIDLGTETPGTTNYATGSFMYDVGVYSASGRSIWFESNTGIAWNIWMQAVPSNGRPILASAPNMVGLYVTGSTFSGRNVHVEGYYEGGDVRILAPSSYIDGLHIEAYGVFVATDAISIGSSAVHITDTFVCGVGIAQRRDIVRVATAVEFVTIDSLTPSAAGCGTFTYANTLTDVDHPLNTIPNTVAFVESYVTLDTTNTLSMISYTDQNFKRNVSLTGVVPTISLIDSSGGATRPFSMRNQTNSWIVRDLVNAIDVITAQAGGATRFGGIIQPVKFAFAAIGTFMTTDGDIGFCTNCNGRSDGGYVAGQICASAPGTGAFVLRSGGVNACY